MGYIQQTEVLEKFNLTAITFCHKQHVLSRDLKNMVESDWMSVCPESLNCRLCYRILPFFGKQIISKPNELGIKCHTIKALGGAC